MRHHITHDQRDALRRAHYTGLDPADLKVHPRTFGILRDEGLIYLRVGRKGIQRWRASPLGYRLLALHTPRFLHRKSQYGYTSRPELALRREPEAMA